MSWSDSRNGARAAKATRPKSVRGYARARRNPEAHAHQLPRSRLLVLMKEEAERLPGVHDPRGRPCEPCQEERLHPPPNAILAQGPRRHVGPQQVLARQRAPKLEDRLPEEETGGPTEIGRAHV